MAYVITNQNMLYKIAADDTAKSNLNINESDYEIVNISDADFNKIKLGIGKLEYSNGSYSVVDIENGNIITSEKNLISIIDNYVRFFDNWLNNNSGNVNYNKVLNFCNFLKSFDTSQFSYPTNHTFEQYLNDNSIDFITPLQI